MKILHGKYIHRAALAGGAVLTLLAAGCGGGGGGVGAPASAPAPAPAQTSAALQGIWQSAAGAASAVSAIALPNGQVWSIVSAAGTVRLVKVELAAQGAGFGGAGTSYTLGGASAGATVSATVVEKSTLTGAIATAGGQPEAFALAYQSRYDRPAALSDFAGNWQAELGPGVVNWTFGANGALSGTRTTGCTYTGQLALRAEAKAVVDVAVVENCAGASTALQGVAVLSADRTRISMATTTADGASAVVVSLAR